MGAADYGALYRRIDGLVGPEFDQQAAARGRMNDSMLTGPALGNANFQGDRVNHANVDLRSPQQFTTHPNVELALADSAVGAENAPHLPGRVPGPDGEPETGA
jgi:hypothetical protein